MKLKYGLLFAAAVLFALGSCAKKDNDELAHHHHEHSHSHETHDHAGHAHEHHDGEDDEAGEGGDVIKLSPEVAELFGLSTERAGMRDICTVVKAGGVVVPSAEDRAVVSAPTAGIVTIAAGLDVGSEVKTGTLVATVKAGNTTGGDANRVAKVDLDAAKAEFERVEALYADRLVTLSQYNAAKSAYDRAKASYSPAAATGRATAPAAGVISGFDVHTGQYVEAGQPIAAIASANRLVVRIEVPVRDYSSISSARDARITLPATGESLLLGDLDGRRLDLNSPAASVGGYVPVTFSVRNDGTLVPGQAVEAYVLGNGGRSALAVPVSALSEQQGTFFVYQQLDEDCYRRIPVTTGVSDGAYVEVIGGLEGGENIVVAGVTAVKLAQTSGNVPEGHSHSH